MYTLLLHLMWIGILWRATMTITAMYPHKLSIQNLLNDGTYKEWKEKRVITPCSDKQREILTKQFHNTAQKSQ